MRTREPGSRGRPALRQVPPPRFDASPLRAARSGLSRLSRQVAVLAGGRGPLEPDGTVAAGAGKPVVVGAAALAIGAAFVADLSVGQAFAVFMAAAVALAVAGAVLGQAARFLPRIDEWTVGFMIIAVVVAGGSFYVLFEDGTAARMWASGHHHAGRAR